MAESGVRRDGPADAACTLVLAHGAGAGMDTPFLAAAARAFAAAGIGVVRFEFDYMAARQRGERPMPDRMPVLQRRFTEVVRSLPAGTALAVGGKSMGGRVATMLADALGARACVVFGYPFHPPRQPTRLRVAHLAELRTPTLILQGERDPFGTRAEVDGYARSPAVTVHWVEDGDHSLVPRRREGHDPAASFAAAMATAIAFLQQHCGGRRPGEALA